MPVMRPLPIPTKTKGFFSALWTWVESTRQWELMEDFFFTMKDGTVVYIPAGFTHDGASIPKALRGALSPVGIMLIAGILHDFLYKYRYLKTIDGELYIHTCTRKEADDIFREVNIQVNGMAPLINAAYYSLRSFGFVAWNSHRKAEDKAMGIIQKKIDGSGDMY